MSDTPSTAQVLTKILRLLNTLSGDEQRKVISVLEILIDIADE